mgnify:CR=1 FL=1
MRVDVVHQRDPDSACSVSVYVDGVEVEFHQWSFDPAAGCEMDSFADDRDERIASAPGFLQPVLTDIYAETESTYRRYGD